MRSLLLPVFFLMACLCAAQSYVETDNVTYTSASGQPQQLDLFQPTPSPSPSTHKFYPGIVFVHGGGWTSGEKEDFKGWGQYYASLGYVCISINYRMIPNVWPAEIDDPQAAVRWMRKNAAILHLNPNKVGAVGISAGAHLALLLGECDTLNDFDPTLHGYSSKVQAVAEFFGPTDFSNQAEWDPSIWNLIQELIGPSTSTSHNPNYYAASPINYCAADNAPTIIFQGDADPVVPVDQSRRIVTKKRALGAAVSYFEFPGEGHGFSNDDTLACVYYINSFFASYLGG